MKKKLLKISLVGRTNAGKSTLINKLVGEQISIINKKINTTEDLIHGILNINNIQLVFFDTPGFKLDKEYDKKKPILKRNLWEGINISDLILFLIDSKNFKLNENIEHLKKLLEFKKKIIVVFNKNDLIDKKSILPMIKELDKFKKISNFFSISAKLNKGINYLITNLLNNSYQSDWLYLENEISNKNDIFITNECTRNALLTVLHKEIPYNLKINNMEFKYLKNGDLKIKQEIEIENPRYKKIILGTNGDKIKDIRIKSQMCISKILKCKTHLYLKIINAKKN